MERRRPRLMTMGLTRLGVVAMATVSLLAFAAAASGRNELYLLLASLVAMLASDLWLGPRNLSGLRAARRLPAELFAGIPAGGRLALRREGSGAAWGLSIRAGGGARASLGRLPPGDAVDLPVTWRPPRRGTWRISAVEVSSTYPLGFFRRAVSVGGPEEVLAYPTPGDGSRRGGRPPGGDGDAGGEQAPNGTGELLDLRPYREGDPLNRVHWPTSARLGLPMMAERGGPEEEEGALVELHCRPGAGGFEEGISLACGEVLHHLARGRSVTLLIGEVRHGPRAGLAGRTAFLSALANLPHGGDPP